MPEVVVCADIAAPVDRVWPIVADIALMPRFSAELQRVEWADGVTGPALGARFLGVNRHPAIGEWTTTSQITDYEPPRRFGWAVGDPGRPAATWCFDLEPTAAGSRLRYTARLGPGPSGVSMLIEREPEREQEIVVGRLRQWEAGMHTVLAGIRGLAESGS